MTEPKQKTTKKEVVKKSDAKVTPAKKAKAKEPTKKQIIETVESDKVAAVVLKEETEVVEGVEKVKKVKKVKKVEKVEEVKKVEKVEKVEAVEAVEAVEKTAEVKEKKVRKPRKGVKEPEIKPEKEISVKKGSGIVASAEDFDWDSFESEEKRISPRYKEYELLYDETLSTVAVDEVVIGTVIQMTSREVVINIGYKSEGVVSLNEFRYNPELKAGDKVEVYVESQEDKRGGTGLMHLWKKMRSLPASSNAVQKVV